MFLKGFVKAVLAIAMVVVAGTGISFARVNATSENELTGPFSNNINTWTLRDDFDLDILNDYYLSNDLDFRVNTGRNDFLNNTKIGDIRTGSVTGNFTVSSRNNNSNPIIMVGNNENNSVRFENDTTGPNSQNINDATINSDRDIRISNRTYVNNDTDIRANTGENTIASNTCVGDVTTGDVRVSANVSNTSSQSSIGTINLGANDQSSSVNFENFLTGPNSDNQNLATINNDTDIRVRNNTTIRNDADVRANTGRNTVANNTVVGDVETGSVNISLSTTNAN